MKNDSSSAFRSILFIVFIYIRALSSVNAQDEFSMKWSVEFERSPLSNLPSMSPVLQDLATTDETFSQIRTLQKEHYKSSDSSIVTRAYRYHILDYEGRTLLTSDWFYGETLSVGRIIHTPSEFVFRVSGSSDPNADGFYRAVSSGTASRPEPFGNLIHYTIQEPIESKVFYSLSGSLLLSEPVDQYREPKLQNLSIERWGFIKPLPILSLNRSGESVTISWKSELNVFDYIEVSENLLHWESTGEQVKGTGEVIQATIIEPRTRAFFRVRRVSP